MHSSIHYIPEHKSHLVLLLKWHVNNLLLLISSATLWDFSPPTQCYFSASVLPILFCSMLIMYNEVQQCLSNDNILQKKPWKFFFFWGWKSIKFCSGWVIHKISYILFFEDGTKDRMTSQQQLKTAAVKEKKILDVNNFQQSRILDNVLKHLWLYQLVQLYWSPWKLGENGCNYRNIFVHPLKLRLCSSAVTCFILNLLRWHIKTNILTVGSVSKHLLT